MSALFVLRCAQARRARALLARRAKPVGSHPTAARFARAGALSLSLLLTAPLLAQEAEPPSGPAQIFNQAAKRRDARDVAQAQRSSEEAAQQANPQPAQQNGPSAPEAPHDHAHQALAAPSMSSAQEAAELPAGTIQVEVHGPDGKPYPNAEIVLGVMASMGTRTEQRHKADAQGKATIKGLATGSQQAYRVNVVYGGAKFSTTPFRLPDNMGYRATVELKPTTQSDRLFFQLVGQTVLELRDDRLHITQQARLANAGNEVFVLPKDGLVVQLPEGFTAFQWQDQMTDQRGEEVAGRGFRLRGSFPPGSVTLAWTYDLKREGTQARVPVQLPFKTYTYRVIAEAPEGSKLRVSEFPEPERVQDEGRSLWFTQIQKSPGDPLLGSVNIKLDGIPGPGPARWIATAIATLLALFGLAKAFKRSDDSVERKAYLQERKEALLASARAIDEEHKRGESGPEYHAKKLEEIETELALVLKDQEALGPVMQTKRA